MSNRSQPEHGTKPSNRRRSNLPLASAVLSACATAALFFSSSCGPSVQSIYEGNVRFEHCYRLDLDVNVAPSHREACWKRWLSAYTYGQPRDRIEYARRRVRAFAAGDTTRPALNIGSEHRPQDRQFYLVVPAPTNLHAPPPPIATRIRGVETSAPPPVRDAGAPKSKTAPGENCAENCRTAWESCLSACEAESALPDDKSSASQQSEARREKSTAIACKSCEPDYKACMKRCFE